MKKIKFIYKDDLFYEEEAEEIGFCDVILGALISQFTFENNWVTSNEPMVNQKHPDVQ